MTSRSRGVTIRTHTQFSEFGCCCRRPGRARLLVNRIEQILIAEWLGQKLDCALSSRGRSSDVAVPGDEDNRDASLCRQLALRSSRSARSGRRARDKRALRALSAEETPGRREAFDTQANRANELSSASRTTRRHPRRRPTENLASPAVSRCASIWTGKQIET